MKIDNSRAMAWWFCPQKYQERYVNNLEPRGRDTTGLDFGTRFHQLLEGRHQAMQGLTPTTYAPMADETLEAEARVTFAGYEAYYPQEPFDIISTEEYFEVPLPCDACIEANVDIYKWDRCTHHEYVGEFDAIVRNEESGRLWLLETKTEARGGKSNLPDTWFAKSQVSLYLWAAEQVYGEEFEGILLNVITRQSPKGQCPPTFRRDNLQRTKAQQRDAVKSLIWVADQIENMGQTGYYPPDRNNCLSSFGWRCDYWALHTEPEGRPSDEVIQIKYKPAEEYLSGL